MEPSLHASAHHDALASSPQASWWSLKKQFKGVFHNVSRVIDCVSCQKCRLHAKVTMLGYGTALKLLLLPPELFPTSVSRDEVAALFNTLHKFSSAITHVKELTELSYARYYAADGPAAAAAAAAATATATATASSTPAAEATAVADGVALKPSPMPSPRRPSRQVASGPLA